LLTQNVDGLHRAAGSRNVIEIHGNIHRFRCDTCGHRQTVDALEGRWDPPCPRCERPLRPDIVLFEEELPRDQLATYERELREGFDLVMIIGTTAGFPYIAGPVVRAARFGVPTIEINPSETELSHFVAYRFAAGAGQVLGALCARL
jgi:NAD-dependent deacetylase